MGLVDSLQKKMFGKKAVTGTETTNVTAVPEKKKGFLGKKKKDEITKEVPAETASVDTKSVKEEKSLEDFDLEDQVFTEDQAVNKFAEGLVGVQDLIAPAAIEVDFSHMKMNEKFFRTLFVLTYPNMLPTNWMAGVINLPHNLAVSTFYYPIDSRLVMQKLKRKISEFQATLNMTIDEGKIPDPGIKIALDDAQKLQELLAKNEEKYFHYALYITIQADSLKELNDITTEVESTLGTLGIVGKPASLEMELGFQSCIPTGMDNLYKTRNMSTDAISATFPFVTSSLTMDTGVLYGLNRHNNSLVVFDRFSMENANTVVFATSGAGKSYMVKLEIYRSMMLGAKVVVIDPEREYEALCATVGGSYISFSQTGGDKINPFDLSGVYEKEENELADKRLFLLGLMRLMLGGVSPEEKALLDKAIGLTYQEKGITDDPATQKNTPPLMEDLYKILKGMAEVEAHALATRLEMFIRGAAAGVFDRPTSVDLNNPFTVFSLQELSDELRPIAMYMMLDYIWTRIRKDRSKRILVVDEAWYMMQHEDSARFLYWFAKRARKYFLGVTTITQDVEDFLGSKYGKAIVTNSAIKFLLKQNTAAIDKIQEVFKLSEGERLILLNSGVGEGLFFAGQNHVMVQVVSSEHEHKIVSTDPREAAKRKQELQTLSTTGATTSDASKKLQDEGRVVGVEGGKVGGAMAAPQEVEAVQQAMKSEAAEETISIPTGIGMEDIQVETTEDVGAPSVTDLTDFTERLENVPLVETVPVQPVNFDTVVPTTIPVEESVMPEQTANISVDDFVQPVPVSDFSSGEGLQTPVYEEIKPVVGPSVAPTSSGWMEETSDLPTSSTDNVVSSLDEGSLDFGSYAPVQNIPSYQDVEQQSLAPVEDVAMDDFANAANYVTDSATVDLPEQPVAVAQKPTGSDFPEEQEITILQ